MAFTKPVRLVATGNINLATPGTIDGQTLADGDRVFLVGQTDPIENGGYVSDATPSLSRPSGGNDPFEHGALCDNATLVYVTDGDVYAGSCWGPDPADAVYTIDTDPIHFTQVALPPVQAKVATTGNIDIANGPATIDGVTVTGFTGAGARKSDVVLVKHQDDPTENGLRWANPGGAMARCSEPLVPGRAVVVSQGDRNAHTRHELVTKGPILLDTTALRFAPSAVTQFNAPVELVANSEITLSGGQTIDEVDVTDGMRVLARRQGNIAAHAANGIYEANTAGAWTRAVDFDTNAIQTGGVVYVNQGVDNRGKLYSLAPLDAAFVLGTDELGFTRLNLPKGTYDPTDYGAFTTTDIMLTPTDAGFRRMFAEIAPQGFGGPFPRVLLPRRTVFDRLFYFEDFLRITRACIFEGEGPGLDGSAAKLRFAKYKNVIVHSITNSPDGGAGDGTIVRNLMIEGSHVGDDAPELHPKWASGSPFGPGDKVTVEAARSTDPTHTLAYHYECVAGTTSGGTEPTWMSADPTVVFEVDVAEPWTANTDYAFGSVVRASTRSDAVFMPGLGVGGHPGIPLGETRQSGGTEPVGFAGAAFGAYVDETHFSWLCVDASTRIVLDNDITWTRRVCAGIVAMTKVVVDNVFITGFLNAGVNAVAWNALTPPANVNASSFSNMLIQNCGVGTNMGGSDANVCQFSNLSIIFNPSYDGAAVDDRRVGILDASELGNRYMNVNMDVATGAGTYVPATAFNGSAFYGLHEEGSCGPNDCISAGASYWGGVVVGFTTRSTHYGAPNASKWTNVRQISTTGDGHVVKSTFHDEVGSLLYGVSTDDTADAGYAAVYSTGALGRGYWTYDYANSWPALALTTARAPEGFGHLVLVGYLAGRSADRRYVFEDKDSVTFSQIKYAARTVGDRVHSNDFAKRGDFLARVVTTPGFDAALRTDDTPYASQAQTGPAAVAASTIRADVLVGGVPVPHVFACVATGTSATAMDPAPDFTGAAPDPVYRRVWTAGAWFELGAYCRPPTPNTNVYRADSYVDPNADHVTGGMAPTFGPAMGPDGNIFWVEEADPEVASLVTDGVADPVTWQCIGPVAKYSRAGYIAPEASMDITDADLAVLDNYGEVPVGTVTRYHVTVSAYDNENDSTGAVFEVDGAAIRNADAATLMGYNAVKTFYLGTTGTWTVALAVAVDTNELLLQVSGTGNIRWKSQLKMSETFGEPVFSSS